MVLLALHDTQRYESPVAVDDEDLASRVERMLLVVEAIRKDEETRFKTDDIYEAAIYPGLLMWELLYSAANPPPLNHDQTLALRLAIDQATTVEPQNIQAATVVASLGLFEDSQYVPVDNESDWRRAIRTDLREDQKSSADFRRMCAKAFPALEFSSKFPGCLDTLEGGLDLHKAMVVSALSALSEWVFPVGAALTEQLAQFSILSGFETSLEGNGNRKDDLTFSFVTSENVTTLVLCEPHMKLSSSDQVGDTKYYFNRIYFCPRPNENFPGRILVGHAGKHL